MIAKATKMATLSTVGLFFVGSFLFACKSSKPNQSQSDLRDVYIPDSSSTGTFEGKLYMATSINGKDYVCRLNCEKFTSNVGSSELRKSCATGSSKYPMMIPIEELDSQPTLKSLILDPSLSTLGPRNMATLDEMFEKYDTSGQTDPLFKDTNSCLKFAKNPGILKVYEPQKPCELIAIQHPRPRIARLKWSSFLNCTYEATNHWDISARDSHLDACSRKTLGKPWSDDSIANFEILTMTKLGDREVQYFPIDNDLDYLVFLKLRGSCGAYLSTAMDWSRGGSSVLEDTVINERGDAGVHFNLVVNNGMHLAHDSDFDTGHVQRVRANRPGSKEEFWQSFQFLVKNRNKDGKSGLFITRKPYYRIVP
jgi:hypothetical protein